MINNFSETIAPWLLGVLVLLNVIMVIVTIRYWREMKRSPYFFLRQQAEKKFQTYSSTSLVLLLLISAISVYTLQSPQADDVVRVAILSNTKPPEEEIMALLEDAELATADTAVTEPIVIQQSGNLLEEVVSETAVAEEAEPALPDKFDQYEPQVDLQPDTDLGSIAFSTEIDEEYQAVGARNLFAEGFYTLYATFSYEDMADGMAWAWVWRYNDDVVDGGNELWAYGDDGPGYIYLNPDEGFQNGEYTLEVWVNGELFTQSTAVMNTAALAAGN